MVNDGSEKLFGNNILFENVRLISVLLGVLFLIGVILVLMVGGFGYVIG